MSRDLVLAFIGSDPFVEVRGMKLEEVLQKGFRLWFNHEEGAMLGADEPRVNGVIDLREQRRVKVLDVQQSARLLVQTELGPGDYLAKLFQRSIPSRHCDECIGQFGHQS